MTHRFSRRLVAYVAPALAMAIPTCVIAGPIRSTTATAGHHLTRQAQYGWMAPNANPKHSWLYVAGNANNVITAYDLEAVGSPLIGTISQGVSSPAGIALDQSGNLYVPNQNANNVTVYAPGATSPMMTLTGVPFPETVAIDSSGNVFVGNRDGSPGIEVYAPGQTQPFEHIASGLLTSPAQLAFGPDGTLYVTDNYTGVSYISPGSTVVNSLNLKGINQPYSPSGLAADPIDGILFISNSAPPPIELLAFPFGSQDASRMRRVPVNGTDFIAAGQVKKQELIFAPDSYHNVIYVYKAKLRGQPGVITTTSQSIDGVAFKPAGVP